MYMYTIYMYMRKGLGIFLENREKPAATRDMYMYICVYLYTCAYIVCVRVHCGLAVNTCMYMYMYMWV